MAVVLRRGGGRPFGVEPVRKKLTFIHSHSFICADGVCPIESSDGTDPRSDNARTHTHTMKSTAACSLTRTDTTATT